MDWPTSLVGSLLILGFIALDLMSPILVEGLRLRAFDQLQRWWPREATASSPVLIVDVDEESMSRIGQWPWPRSALADLIDRLTERGALVVAFDIVFAEPDRLSPPAYARMMLQETVPDVAARLEELPSTDEQMAEVMRTRRVVLGRAGLAREIGGEAAMQTGGPSVAHIGPDPRPFLVGFASGTPIVPILADAASGVGLVTVTPEFDGIVRRVPVVGRVGNTVLAGLALETLRVATGQSTVTVRSTEQGILGVLLQGIGIPTDRQGRVWVHYSPRRHDLYVSAADVIEGRVGRERLANRLILVGASATGLADIKPTPVDSNMPGVEVQAQLLETILENNHLRRPPEAIGGERIVILVLGLALAWSGPLLRASWLPPILALVTIAGGAITWYAFVYHNLLVDGVMPTLAMAALLFWVAMAKYIREEQRRRAIRHAFGHYVAPAMVDRLIAGRSELRLGGELRDMTVMFADIRRFTALTENFVENPERLTQILNRYFTEMTDVILGFGGTIDKYIGDAIMSFWNAPLETAGHAGQACRAARQMHIRLASLNKEIAAELAERGLPFEPLEIGVGLNTGSCYVGNLGSRQRFNYSVIGDAVNVAARIEGQCKTYGVSPIVGESTAAATAGLAFLELDLIRLAGKTVPIRIYALLGDDTLANEPSFVGLRDANARMLASYRTMAWDDAEVRLAECRAAARQVRDLTKLYKLYDARIIAFRAAPPKPGWDGSCDAEGK